eukprot:GFKZ01008055.1.p2 GENE.GFKZ01008055.1~~GFKZ01008055.1.p2  ORF type:complete len:103 (+),score=22.60 GFKZ01008055.1:1115-1423(+)
MEGFRKGDGHAEMDDGGADTLSSEVCLGDSDQKLMSREDVGIEDEKDESEENKEEHDGARFNGAATFQISPSRFALCEHDSTDQRRHESGEATGVECKVSST